MSEVGKALAGGLGRAARAILSAALWLAVLFVAGVSMLVGGVFLLWGVGWSLLAGGGLCLVIAVLLLMGIARA